MKTITLALLCSLAFTDINAQAPDLTGTWTMFEMTFTTPQGNQKTTEDQIKANASQTDYFFLEEGKFKMISNMSGSGTMDTYVGTWKLAENKLTLSLTIGGRVMDIIWDFEFKDNIMNLTRTSPDGSQKIVNSFRKK